MFSIRALMRYSFVGLLGVAVVAGTAIHAASLSASYYVMSSSDPDAGNGTGYTVQNTLGPDGLPVLNVSGTPALNDINSQDEILWWRTSSTISSSGTGSITLPFSSAAMYPPQGQNPSGNDANGFLTAEFTGTLTVPTTESVSFNLGSDDDSFLYVNGVLVSGLPGLHGISTAPVSTETLAPGTYTLDLFYADREQVDAELDFSINTAGVSLNPPSGPSSGTPEPSSLAMLGAGFAAIVTVLRKQRAHSKR